MPTQNNKLPVYILTGSTGLTGLDHMRMCREQFPDVATSVRLFAQISRKQQVEEIVQRAKADGAIIMHTFVKKELARFVAECAQQGGVQYLDIVGPGITLFESVTDRSSAEMPGHVHHDGHSAIPDALRFTLQHDDGSGERHLHMAHIVLIGLSGAGKTEVALKLALYGLWVGNVPIVPNVPPSIDDVKIDARRIYYLDVAPKELEARRRKRWQAEGSALFDTAYVDLDAIEGEVTKLRRMVAAHQQWNTIRATAKTVPQIVGQVIEKYQNSFSLA